MSNYYAGVVTNAVAVLITSAGSPLFTFFRTPLLWIARKLASLWGGAPPPQHNNARGYDDIRDIMLQQMSVRRGIVHLPVRSRIPVVMNGLEVAAKLFYWLTTAIVAFGLPTCLVVASVASAGLATDTTACSAYAKCGRYVYNPDLTNVSGPFLEYEHRAESQAGLYASDSYGPSPLVDDCNKLYSQSIAYATSNTTCPFDGGVCLDL